MSVLHGWASIGENGRVSGGKPGDQKQTSSTNDTKGEVKLGSWYSFGQTEVYVWADEALAKKYAKAVKTLCNDSDVGYNQLSRTTLYSELEKLNWDYTKLKTKCNCDCSELVVCAYNCAVGKSELSKALYTGNLGPALVATKKLKKMTAKKYLTSADHLPIGAISNSPGHHVISCLENGPKAITDKPPVSTGKVAKPTLKKGSKGAEVTKLQNNLTSLGFKDQNNKKLDKDGEFGSLTCAALRKFQKKYKLEVDGIYGDKSAAKMNALIK